MNREDIIRMAQEAGFEQAGHTSHQVFTAILERFFHMAQAAEREACAQIVENEACQYASPVWAFEIVNDIRARGQA